MLRFVGDINLTDSYFDVGFGVGSKLKNCKFDPFENVIRKQEDCWIGNFEGVASETSERTGVAALQFRVDPQNIVHLKHFNIYGIANNHVMQHGGYAYQRTFEFLTSQGCLCFGSNEKKTQMFEHQNTEISITGFSQRVDAFSETPCYWHNPEYKDIEEELSTINQDAYKIVYVHWGNEFVNRPSSQQKRFAHWLVDAGFDLVIGMHPHVLQGYEKFHGKYIFYSLGNFVFDMPWKPTKYGAIVSVDLSKMPIIPSIDYVRINDDFVPQIIDEQDVPQELRFDYLNKQILKEDNSEEYHSEINRCYKQYRKVNHKDILRKMLSHPSIIRYTMSDYFKRRFIIK